MTDFSIEMAIERIFDARTRGYFAEVYRSYTSGNFRSAVVMLWSTTICDLLFKLDHLVNAYNDPSAKAILEDVEKRRKQNAKSAEWEWFLVQEVEKRTQLLEVGDFANLESLQSHRHLSAHPVLSATEVLFSPNAETARAHLRNALEGVLTKPPLMSKKIFDPLIEDLEASGELFPSNHSLKRYLEAKYLTNLVPAVEDNIFRSLWRIVFRSNDPRAEKNRDINYRALAILFDRRPQITLQLLQADRTYYSDINPTGAALSLFHKFISAHPTLFNLLTDAARTPLEWPAAGLVDTPLR